MRMLIYAVPVILALYALIDCVRNEAPTTSRLPKPIWILIIIVVPVIGPLAWFLVSRFVEPGGVQNRKTKPNRPTPRGVRAPDDDPDFLWRLEQQSRRRRREREERDSGEEPRDEPQPPIN